MGLLECSQAVPRTGTVVQPHATLTCSESAAHIPDASAQRRIEWCPCCTSTMAATYASFCLDPESNAGRRPHASYTRVSTGQAPLRPQAISIRASTSLEIKLRREFLMYYVVQSNAVGSATVETAAAAASQVRPPNGATAVAIPVALQSTAAPPPPLLPGAPAAANGQGRSVSTLDRICGDRDCVHGAVAARRTRAAVQLPAKVNSGGII